MFLLFLIFWRFLAHALTAQPARRQRARVSSESAAPSRLRGGHDVPLFLALCCKINTVDGQNYVTLTSFPRKTHHLPPRKKWRRAACGGHCLPGARPAFVFAETENQLLKFVRRPQHTPQFCKWHAFGKNPSTTAQGAALDTCSEKLHRPMTLQRRHK